MRTTLSLDDDVASLLRQEMRRTGNSLKGVVNHFLRAGLMSTDGRLKKPFIVSPRSLGLPPGLSYDSVADLLENLVEEAAAIVDQWLAQPNVRLLVPGDRYWSILRRTMVDGQVRGPLITHAQLAALTVEYGGVLQTTDRDFARFPGLRWRNPLQGGLISNQPWSSG